jgi:hypothetical protein
MRDTGTPGDLPEAEARDPALGEQVDARGPQCLRQVSVMVRLVAVCTHETNVARSS